MGDISLTPELRQHDSVCGIVNIKYSVCVCVVDDKRTCPRSTTSPWRRDICQQEWCLIGFVCCMKTVRSSRQITLVKFLMRLIDLVNN